MNENLENCCDQNSETVQTESLTAAIIEIKTQEQLETEFLLDKETQSQIRFDLCSNCDQLIPVINMCKQCGCLMKIKTRIYSATCPLAKW